MKKILYLITKGNFGGAQKYVFDLANSLPKDKFEVVVACGNKDGNLLIDKLNAQNIKTIILENSEREVSLKNDFKTFRELKKIVDIEKPDIVHLNSSKIGLLGSLVILYTRILHLLNQKSFNVPCSIFTAHGWAFNEKNRFWIAKIIFYFSHYLTVLICNKTIAVSNKTKKDIDFLPFIKNKIQVIYNGIEKFETLTRAEARKILGDDNKIIVFSLAELNPNKSIETALKAIASLSENIKERIYYCIAGAGEEKDNLEKLSENLKLNSIVKFLGFVENGKKLLTGADLFLLTSRVENLPFAILEAGSLSLPVIATSVGGIPEIIKDMHSGILVHPQKPKEVAEAITYLIENKNKKEEFGLELKRTVESFFSLEKMVSETIKLY